MNSTGDPVDPYRVIEEHVFSKVEQLILENQDANSVIISALLGGTHLSHRLITHVSSRIKESDKLSELMTDMGFMYYDKRKNP